MTNDDAFLKEITFRFLDKDLAEYLRLKSRFYSSDKTHEEASSKLARVSKKNKSEKVKFTNVFQRFFDVRAESKKILYFFIITRWWCAITFCYTKKCTAAEKRSKTLA